jgi:hypothetical protein
MHGETGVRVLSIESQLALAHADEPTAVVLARYRELLLAPFDALRRDYEALGGARVARHLDELLRAARSGVSPMPPRPEPLLSDEERRALSDALTPRKGER